MSEQNKAIVEQAYANFKSANIEALLSLFADDISWTLPEMEGVPYAGKRTGIAKVAEFFSTLAASQDTLRFEPRELIAEGDRVVSLGSYDWRVKANNNQFGGEFAHVFTISGDKVVAFQEYMDTAACTNAHQKAMTAER